MDFSLITPLPKVSCYIMSGTQFKTQAFLAFLWAARIMILPVCSSPTEKAITPNMPTISSSYTPQQQMQLKDAVSDAIMLASTAVKASADFKNPIYKSYFLDTNLTRKIVNCTSMF